MIQNQLHIAKMNTYDNDMVGVRGNIIHRVMKDDINNHPAIILENTSISPSLTSPSSNLSLAKPHTIPRIRTTPSSATISPIIDINKASLIDNPIINNNPSLRTHSVAFHSLLRDKRQLSSLLHEKLLRLCRTEPNHFVNYISGYENRRWLGQGAMHVRWQQALTDHPRVLLICPREHGKTSQLIPRLLWELGHDCNLRVKLICQGDDTAVKRLTALTEHIENNPRVREVFPQLVPAIKGEWSKTKIYIQRSILGATDPTVEACGILSTATGGRADLLIFDDPVDFRNAIQQPSLRATVKEVYKNVWMQVLENDGGRVWYAATPWHMDDLTHDLLATPDTLYHKVTDSIDDEFHSIWPEKWPRHKLLEKFRDIGRRAFDRAYRNKALLDDDQLFPEHLFARCERKELRFGQIPPDWPLDKVKYFMGVDFAAAIKPTAQTAYSVLFTIAMFGNLKCPVSVQRAQYSSPQFAKLLIDEYLRYQHTVIYAESNAQQQALIQWITELGEMSVEPQALPIKGFFTGEQKRDEVTGLPGLAVELETGSWVIPDRSLHEQHCKCGFCVWINEMTSYPVGKYKDTVMGCWFAREAARQSNLREPKVWGLMNSDDDSVIEIGDGETIEHTVMAAARPFGVRFHNV